MGSKVVAKEGQLQRDGRRAEEAPVKLHAEQGAVHTLKTVFGLVEYLV